MNKQAEFHQVQKHLADGRELFRSYRNRNQIIQSVSELRKEYRAWFNEHVQLARNGNRDERSIIVEVCENGTLLTIRRKFLDETFAKNLHNNQLAETMKVAKHFEEWIPCAKFKRKETGIHHSCSFLVYLAFYKGMSIEFKVKDDGSVYMMRLL